MSTPAQSRVTDVVATPVTHRPRNKRRADIEGLRAVAALLVAVYHIWFGTVSGGVDVFLLLTGFLITGSLVRSMERDGRIAYGALLAKLVKRLFPAGAVVLGAVLVGTYLFLPRSRWIDIIAEVQASALYYGNWHLALGSVDYMADNTSASPVQHFWSLAIQGQFYLLWPILITIAALVAFRFGLSIRRAALVAVGAVLAGSFSYSLWITTNDPVWAYFDTGARLWELALGGVLALVISHLRLPPALRDIAGWVGLVALVSCGMVIGDADFPGHMSLWPTLAAVLIIVAGAGDEEPGRLSANRLLGLRPLARLGGHAYTLFLWHWPILIFHLEITDQVRPTPSGGFLVLGISFVAAIATSRLVDGGVSRVTAHAPRNGASWALAAGVLFVVPVLVGGLAWNNVIERDRELRTELSSNPLAYPGAAIHLSPELAGTLPSLPVYPDTSTVQRDTIDQTRECNALIDDEHLVVCDFGDVDSDYTIVLTGSSHARHWFQALNRIAERHGWHLVTMTKNACQFSAETQYRNGEPFETCNTWNEQVMEELHTLQPDAVFSLATRTQNGGHETEHVPEGYQERWNRLDTMGIDVFAVRDTPRFEFNVAECVDHNGPGECVAEQSRSMAEEAPFEDLTDVPANTHFIDLTPYLCQDGRCPGVIGNQLAYYDTNHFSYAFSRSLAVVLESYLLEAAEQAPTVEPTLLESTAVLHQEAPEASPEASHETTPEDGTDESFHGTGVSFEE